MTVTGYFSSDHLLQFGFAEQYTVIAHSRSRISRPWYQRVVSALWRRGRYDSLIPWVQYVGAVLFEVVSRIVLLLFDLCVFF